MTKYAGRGIVVSVGATPLGQLLDFGEIGNTRDLIDVSAYGDEWKDYLGGLRDGTEVSGVVAYDPADSGHLALLAADDGDPHTFSLDHADASENLDFTGVITQITRGGSLGGAFQMSFTIKIVNPGVEAGS